MSSHLNVYVYQVYQLSWKSERLTYIAIIPNATYSQKYLAFFWKDYFVSGYIINCNSALATLMSYS